MSTPQQIPHTPSGQRLQHAKGFSPLINKTAPRRSITQLVVRDIFRCHCFASLCCHMAKCWNTCAGAGLRHYKLGHLIFATSTPTNSSLGDCFHYCRHARHVCRRPRSKKRNCPPDISGCVALPSRVEILRISRCGLSTTTEF